MRTPDHVINGNVRAEMARRGWTFDKLAAKSGVPAHTLRRRLRGATHGLTIEELRAIADALDVRLDALLWEGDREDA